VTQDERAATSQPPLVNRVMARLLRSPLSRLVDRGVMLLTVNGRRTGHVYTFPVQYVEDGTVLWVYVGDDAVKTWWRNLLGGAKVQVLLRRSIHTGTAVALRQADDPELVAQGLRRYNQRFPRTARRLGIPTDDPRQPRDGAANMVMVRIELAPTGGEHHPDGGSIDGSIGDETARR
jgi:deazaflavin-dependent oxidoreductase (nitroreductase family)